MSNIFIVKIFFAMKMLLTGVTKMIFSNFLPYDVAFVQCQRHQSK